MNFELRRKIFSIKSKHLSSSSLWRCNRFSSTGLNMTWKWSHFQLMVKDWSISQDQITPLLRYSPLTLSQYYKLLSLTLPLDRLGVCTTPLPGTFCQTPSPQDPQQTKKWSVLQLAQKARWGGGCQRSLQREGSVRSPDKVPRSLPIIAINNHSYPVQEILSGVSS